MRLAHLFDILRCFNQKICSNDIGGKNNKNNQLASFCVRKRIKKMIQMKVKHPINGSITPFRNNAIDAIMCCHGVSETRSEKTGKWEDEGATSSFWHRNAHSERNMNTNDNGMQCDGHATKNQLPQCQWTFSCGNIWIVNASTFICFNVLVLALSLSPTRPMFLTFSLYAVPHSYNVNQ